MGDELVVELGGEIAIVEPMVRTDDELVDSSNIGYDVTEEVPAALDSVLLAVLGFGVETKDEEVVEFG